MFSSRRIIAGFIIVTQMLSSPTIGVFAEDEVFHSLDELPSIKSESIQSATIGQNEDDSFESIISKKKEYETMSEETPVEGEKTIEATALIEERSAYVAHTMSIAPNILSTGFITNPFTEVTGSVGLFPNIAESFLGGENTLQSSSRKQWKIFSKKEVPGVKGAVTVSIDPSTIITHDGNIVDISALATNTLDTKKESLATIKFEKSLKDRGDIKKTAIQVAPQGFDFGIPDKHLIFSKPVKITIDTPNASDGIVYDLLTMHAGDSDFNTLGLSISPATSCNPDGSATIPGSQVRVKNGKVTFYTCGASSFSMNPSGGTAGSNDLQMIIGDCGQIQIYYDNQTQIYGGTPPTSGCNGYPSMWPALRIRNATYGNNFTSWTSKTTTGSVSGNTYTATSTMTRSTGGRTYTLILDWSYTAPNKYFTWSYQVIIPSGNNRNVMFYMANDSAVAGGDVGDAGYISSTGGLTVGVYDSTANVLSAYRYIDGIPWNNYEVGVWSTIRSRVSGGTAFNDTIQTTPGDLGFGINWDFGTTPGTYTGTIEWRMVPYVSASVPDLIPGIGQPEGPLTVGLVSQLPITVSNVGNASSTGETTVDFTIPPNTTGPASAFTDNGWSCGAQVGTNVTCTKSGSISGPLGQDTVRIPVIPLAAASGTTVTFNVTLSNSSDSDTSNNTAFATNAVVGGSPTFGPGGFMGSTIWLRADSLSAADGASVSSWTNEGSNTTPATQTVSTKMPVFREKTTANLIDNINFNPVVELNGTSQYLTLSGGIFGNTFHTGASVFAVTTQTNSSTNNFFIMEAVSSSETCPRFGAHIPWSNGNIYWDAGDCSTSRVYTAWGGSLNTPYIWSMNKDTVGTPSGNKGDIRRDGLQIASSSITTGFTGLNSDFFIGSLAGSSNFFAGEIAEVIVTAGGASMTALEQNKIESYLALKYGITLDQTTPTNYTLSDGSVVWNAGSAGVYNKNIAGISRDDTSNLNQIQSQSISNTGDIIVSRPFFGTNYESLTWANNSGSISAFNVTDAPSGYKRIDRKWLFQEKNGDVGDVTISYPSSSLPSGFTGSLMMLVDSDGVFATGATVYTGTLSGGKWNFSANIADTSYITFASNPPSDTIPPVIQSMSIASGTLIPKGDFSLTAAYSDTGSGIQPSSFSTKVYAWNASGSAWSTTDIAPTYTSVVSSTTSTGVINISNIPYGKYRFDISIADMVGNITTQSYTYFVDAIEWTVSSDTYIIGDMMQNMATFGTGELLVTVKTVGAGFSLTTSPLSPLANPATSTINYWNGSWGVGYDIWNISGFGGAILAYSPNATLATMTKNINSDGQKNIYTYRIKYGAKVDFMQEAGDYQGTVSLQLLLDY